MKNKISEDYEKHHATLPNLDLVRIAYFEFRVHTKEARISVKKILKQRKLSDKQIKEIRHQVRTIKKEERKQRLADKDDEYALLGFIKDVAFEGFFEFIFSSFG